MSLHIGVDIDDVLFPWYPKAHDACVKAGHANELPIPTSWHPYLEYGIDVQTWHDILGIATTNGNLYCGEPIDGINQPLQALLDAGHKVHLVTARGYLQHGHIARADTVDWLDTYKVPHTTLTFSQDKTIIPTAYFLDDNSDNIAAVQAAGSRGFLLNQPWNEHAAHEDRVDHVAQFAAHILKENP